MDVHFDLVGDITVATFNTEYLYSVKNEDLEFVNLNRNINVPLCPVEANLILYGMMEGWQSKRRFKRDICFNYLLNNGVKYPQILEEAVKNYCLPSFLKEVVTSLL